MRNGVSIGVESRSDMAENGLVDARLRVTVSNRHITIELWTKEEERSRLPSLSLGKTSR